MPEIWIPYGSVDAPLDIPSENLATIHSIAPQVPSEKELMDKIRGLDVSKSILIFVNDLDKAISNILKAVINHLLSNGLSSDQIAIVSESKIRSEINKICDELTIACKTLNPTLAELGRVDNVPINVPQEIQTYDAKLMISKVGFDPLFGWSGGSSSFLNIALPDLINEAFNRRPDDNPHPGEETDAHKFASNVTDIIGGVQGISVLPSSGEVADIYVGKINDAHQTAAKKLLDTSIISLPDPPKAIICAPGSLNGSSTMSSALKSFWNIIPSLKGGSSAVLLAECLDGLGSEALSLAATNRINLKNLKSRLNYFPGLEDLLYLEWAKQKAKMAMISSIPNYYLEKGLGLKSLRGMSDALPFIFGNQGTKAKVHIVPDAEHTLLKSQ